MAGEIRDGKMTLIEHDGNVFELPYGHTVELEEVMLEDRTDTWVKLDAPFQGSTFHLQKLEERDDVVVVHLGAEIGRHGPPTSGEVIPEVQGHPFP